MRQVEDQLSNNVFSKCFLQPYDQPPIEINWALQKSFLYQPWRMIVNQALRELRDCNAK